MSDSDNKPEEEVKLPNNTVHQVGETTDGEPMMGKDREGAAADGGIDFAAVDKAAAAAADADAEAARENEEDEPAAVPPAADDAAPAESADSNDKDEEKQQQQQKTAGDQGEEEQPHEDNSVPPAPPTPRVGSDSAPAGAGSSTTSVPAGVAPPVVSAAPPPPPDSASSSVGPDYMASPAAVPPLQIPTTSSDPQQARRSDSPARVTPVDEGINKSPEQQQQQDQQLDHPMINEATNNNFSVDPAGGGNEVAVIDEPAPDAVAVPGISQRHLYQFDQEYEDALEKYDADVMSSEAASRFAVGIHSASASATRHFADFCELQSDEAARLVDRRNKKADQVRSMIKQELTRYGFASVAEELSQMTSVLIEDHRRRIDLLADRVRMQLKSTLSQILREQEHAGEALRAEFVKTASVEFAQDSLLELIGIAPESEDKKRERLEKEMTEIAAGKRSPSQQQQQQHGEESVGGDGSGSTSYNQQQDVDKKGKKAVTEVYANELQKRLSSIFDKQTGFATRKAQDVVGGAKANFTRLAEQLSKMEEDNVRRLLTTRERTEKHISDLEMLAARTQRDNIIEFSELESDLKLKEAELKRIRDHKEEVEKEVTEREKAAAERRKTSYGMTAGGLMMGGGALDHLMGGGGGGGRREQKGILDSSGIYGSGSVTPGQSKRDREIDDKLKSASARSKALAEKNAARLQNSRDKQQQQNMAAKGRDTSFARRAGDNGNRASPRTPGAGKTPVGASLSHRNVGRIGGEQMSAAEKARQHVMGDGPDAAALTSRLETREIDPREAVLLHKRGARGGGGGEGGRAGSGPRQQEWVESEALRALAMRTARHGISFPDSSDPIVPTHKFLDDELAAIYELRHLRSPGSTTTASRAAAVAAAERKQQNDNQRKEEPSSGSKYFSSP